MKEIALFTVLITVAYSSMLLLGDDNIIEEVVEDVILNKTNIEIDISPNSKEKEKENE